MSPGIIIAPHRGNQYQVRLSDSREVVAVLPGHLAREVFLVQIGDRVEVTFPVPPKMPRIVRLFRA